MKKAIFITGSSSGVGKATAQLFAVKGWKVIATMRHPEKEATLTKLPNVTLLPLDVSDPAQIETTVEKALAMGDIDVVFNNAAYGMGGPLESIPDEELVRLFNTNLLGPIRITRSFIPHFRTKKRGLFITTSAIGGVIPFPLSSIYGAAKSALEGWSQSMTYELKPFGIGIKTVVPGLIKTDFSTHAYFGSHEAYTAMLNKAMAVMMRDTWEHSTAEQIASVVYEAATDGKEQLRYLVGEDAKTLYEQLQQFGEEAVHQGMEKKFFG